MKKRFLYIIFTILIISFIFSSYISIKADSGWDTDYDYNDDYDFGNNYESNYNSSYGYSGNSSYHSSGHCGKDCYKSELIGISIMLGMIGTTFFIFHLLTRKYQQPKLSNKFNFEEVDIKEILPNFNSNSVKKELYNKFISVQNAWMNFDYDTLRKLCSNPLFNTYYEELEALKIKKQINVMSNFHKIKNKIIRIEKNDDLVFIDYYLDIKFYDYVINSKSKKIVKGRKNKKIHNIYILTFTISTKKQINFCPNCGAHIEDQESVKCKYCNAVIIKNSNNFILSKKRKIS